ncbi:AraC family transcriptional regulator [Bradyrhizobium sp. LjRoot220]|uniref:AraC family transcriptional regulator n=1 Tax=Bradyrhizobium sp. LjRoot220 TaxID=3342284 RepID=UPI003ED0F4F8
MPVPNPAFRFSTTALSPAERLPAWYEVFSRSTSRRYCAPLDETCHTDVRIWTLGPADACTVRVQRVTLSHSIETHRPRELLSDGSDDLVLNIQEAGDTCVSQCGMQATAAAGGAILTSNADVSTIAFRGPVRFTSIALPRRVMMALAPRAEDAIVKPAGSDSAVLHLLISYLAVAEEQSATQSPDLARAVAAHIHDLCALAIGASRDAAEIARGRGLRQARLRMLKEDIASNLTLGPVTAAALAQRHRMTPRYVHKLFEGEGVSLSQFVRAQRLARVHRNLTDPRHAGRAIGELAFDAGYGDLSTFNHDFRRCYGMTPSALRAAARRDER